jgi:hypothetical protein
MKKQIFGLFAGTDAADKAINAVHNNFGIDKEEISYVYRNDDGEKVEGTADDVATDTPAEGAKDGAKVGGVIGAVIGLAAVAGLAGPLGPVLAAGPIATALGIGGAVGTTATGAVAGAAVGGLVGALTHLGLGEEDARHYDERLKAGDVLVSVHTDQENDVVEVLTEHGAMDIKVIEVVA